jgi:hypothetical protein
MDASVVNGPTEWFSKHLGLHQRHCRATHPSQTQRLKFSKKIVIQHTRYGRREEGYWEEAWKKNRREVLISRSATPLGLELRTTALRHRNKIARYRAGFTNGLWYESCRAIHDSIYKKPGINKTPSQRLANSHWHVTFKPHILLYGIVNQSGAVARPRSRS